MSAPTLTSPSAAEPVADDPAATRAVSADPQAEVTAFLSSGSCPVYRTGDARERAQEDGATPFEPARLETHCARLFLGERIVCKIKRAVAYGYLDMTALETRRRLCRRELELNRPALPEVYLDVVAVTREPDGSLAIDGAGEPLEWVLRMRRFEQCAVLDELARAGRLDVGLARRLGAAVARYHAPLPPDVVGGGHARVREVIDELDEELARLGATLPRAASARFATLARGALGRHRALLERRADAGFVRRCHGDLHLRNLLLHDGEPVPFDALEFDERLATTDVLYDLAFLVMDLGHRRLVAEASVVLEEYLLRSAPENVAGLAAFPLFLAMRAAVRAMTSAQALASADTDLARSSLADEARGYLDAALAYLAPRRPLLIAVGGLSGSGKSTLARALAPRAGPAPGAILLGSDTERKAALGVAPLERIDPARYTARAARENYARLLGKARDALGAGFDVVLDATWLDGDARAELERLARELDAPFVGLWLDAPAGTLRRRVDARRGDVSDATPAVLERQLARTEGKPRGWQRLAASVTPEAIARRALGTIARARETPRR